MATTENGIYYPNDGTKAADVLADLELMAKSIDETIGKEVSNNKYDDTKIKQDISDIQKEQSTQNKNIENLQTNDVKQDSLISKLKNAALNAETEESKSLHVTDANKFGQLEVLGNQEQDGEPSPENEVPVICLGSNKNILDTSLIQETTKGGITSKINSDGSITFNGTCTVDNNVFDFYVENTTKFMFDATKDQTTISAFHVSGSITDSNDSRAYFRVNDKNYNGGYINLVNLPQQKQLTHIYNSTSGSVFCDIRFNNGVVLDNFTIKCKAANTLEDAFTYSPYGQGSTLISKINKNIYDIAKYPFTNKIAYNSSGGQVFWDGYCGILDYFPVKENTQYTFSNNLNKPILYGLVFYDKDKQFISVTTSSTTTFTTTEKCEYIRFAIQSDTLPSWIQIELENTATSNIEHKQTDCLLYIQQKMLKGDYFIKEADSWKEVHNWDKYIFTGNESFLEASSPVEGTKRFYYENNNLDMYIYSDLYPTQNNFCNYFKALSWGAIYSSDTTTKNAFICYNSGTAKRIHFRIDSNIASSVNEFKQFLQQKYTEGNPVYAYYKTTTETKLPCTEEQTAVLEELNNMDLFEGVNNIITAEDIALLKLKYALDVETYVDNKIEEKLANINQQILEISGGN